MLLVDTFQAGFTNQVVEGRVLKLALERFQVPLQVCHCLSGFRVIGRISTLSAAGVHAAECNIVLIASALTFCPVAPKSLMDRHTNHLSSLIHELSFWHCCLGVGITGKHQSHKIVCDD